MRYLLLCLLASAIFKPYNACAQFKLFYADATDQNVRACEISGTECLDTGGTPGSDVVADSSNGLNIPDAIEIYTKARTVYVDDGSRIVSFDADGAVGTATTIVPAAIGGNSMVIDTTNLHLYYVQLNSNPEVEIARVDLDGSNKVTFAHSGSSTLGPYRLAIDVANGKLYWSDSRDDTIRRVDIPSFTNETIIFTAPSSVTPSGLALLPATGKLYYSDQADDAIYQVEMDGSTPSGSEVTIASSLDNPTKIVIDAQNQKIYWVEDGNSFDQIVQADLDGSNQIVLFTSSGNPQLREVGEAAVLFDLPTLSPGTTIEVPPIINIDDNDVTFTFQDFDGATLSLGLQQTPNVLPLLPPGTSTVRYEVEASQGSGSTKSTYKAKVTKNAETVVKNFGPGAWVAHYKAVVAKARTADKISSLTDKFQGKLAKANPNSKNAVRLKNVLLKLDAKFKRVAQPQSPDVGFNIP